MNILEKQKNYKSGITLIALVITIIVLLVLAGVSISIVSGDNGVLTQAKNAVEVNREASAIEDVQMAWSSAKSQYLEDFVTNSETDLDTYLTKAKLDQYLVGKGTIETIEQDSDGVYTVGYRTVDQNKLYTLLVTNDGNVTKKTGISLSKYDTTLLIVDGTAQQETITAELEGMKGTIIWTSSDTTKVTVNKGILTPIAVGTAKITATCGTKSAECSVEVKNVITVTVTFDANGGAFGDSSTTKTVVGYSESDAILPTPPKREDFAFTGWYTEATNGTEVYAAGTTTGTLPANDGVIYYAQWSSMPKYTEMGTASLGDYSTIKGKWEYLYSDENNIYLIHKDYLPNQFAYMPTGITKRSDYKFYSTTSRDVFINYLLAESNWENISKVIAEDLNTITGTNNYNTTNVITKGAPTLSQVEKILNDGEHKVGYVKSGQTAVYSNEAAATASIENTAIGTMSSEAFADGWVYCSNWSSTATTNTFGTYMSGYFTIEQNTKLYTSEIANSAKKALGYWLARSFC